MKPRIYVAIIVLIGIITACGSPPPDVSTVAATVTIQPVAATAVVETVASTVTAQPVAVVVETDEATTTSTTVATATFTPSVSVNTAIPKQVVITPTNTVIPTPSKSPVATIPPFSFPTSAISEPTPMPTFIPIPTPTFEPISNKPIGGYIFGKPKLILTHNYVKIVGWLPGSNEELIIRNFEKDKFLVEILNVKTGQRKRVVETSQNIIGNPVWLPANQQMAYLAQDESGTINLYLNSLGMQDISVSTLSNVIPPIAPDKTGVGVLVFDTQMQQLLSTNRNSGAIQKLSIVEPLPIVEGGHFPHYQAAWSENTVWTAYYHPVKFILANSKTGKTQTVNLGKVPGDWGQWGVAHATWSPDGKNLAIIATPSDYASFGPVPFTQLIIYNVSTGEIHHLENDFTYITNVVWAPDNEHVLISAVTGQNAEGLNVTSIFFINITTKQILPIPIIPNDALGLISFKSLAWSLEKYIIIGYTENPSEGRWYRILVQPAKSDKGITN